MSFLPTVISTGITTCAGSGNEAMRKVLSRNSDNFLQQLRLFDSPRYSSKLVGFIGGIKNGAVSRCARILLGALDEAVSKIDLSKFDSRKISLWFGTSIGGIWETENMLVDSLLNGKKESIATLKTYDCSTIAELAAKRIGALGECSTFSTACSSSSIALSRACNALVNGECDLAIVCGADALSRMTVNGFGCLQLLSNAQARPFANDRDGINLGEAGAVAILTTESIAKETNSKILGYIAGWAETADAYHATSPRPDGSELSRSFKSAMSQANLSSSEVDLYMAHGTGTKGNDAAEMSALKSAFGDKIPEIISIKGKIGHTLGASGVVNLVAAINSEYFKNILISSIGFGGNNSCAILTKNPNRHLLKKYANLSAKSSEIFVFGSGLVFSGKGMSCDESQLLKDIPVLKKRKWAKLQRMALQSAEISLAKLSINANEERIGVCLGTGLGMIEESAKFIESTILNRESEPLPTAFTNSVHNACSSLIAMRKNFRGLNSAITAKEISFESALAQAYDEITTDKCDAFIIGSCDEKSPYIEKFLISRGEKTDALSELACTYFIGRASSCANPPIAKIKSIRLERDFDDLLANFPVKSDRIRGIFLFGGGKSYNANKSKVSRIFGIEKIQESEEFGANYSISSIAIYKAIKSGEKGLFASITNASTGMCACVIFEVL